MVARQSEPGDTRRRAPRLPGRQERRSREPYGTSTFEAPVARHDLVRRNRLLRRLETVPASVPLILLTAPAGYGKTTVLTQWAARSDRPFAWVTLGTRDADPTQLTHHIALALSRVLPAAASAPGPGELAARPTDSSRLLSALRGLRLPAVIVLDDLDAVQGRESLALLRELVEAAPPGLRVVGATRTAPSMLVDPLRGEGRCLEFGPDDLSFSEDESRRGLLAAGQPAARENVRILVQQTEGWPAGVYLAGLVARQEGDTGPSRGRPGAIAGDDVYVADYFRDELLAHESADNLRFLMRTSVLDRMSGPLCDALLERTGSMTRLAEAARRNLFVVPLDHDGRWFRYHRLFRQMLLSELRRREPGEELRLHRRAAAWYEREGPPESAIAHALAGHDARTAARLINTHAPAFVRTGRRGTVEGWLRDLSEQDLVAFPPLAVTAGWVWALGGDAVRAQGALRAARAGTFAGRLPDGSGSLESAAALLAALLGPLGVERMLQDAREAVRLEPAGSRRRPLALTALGIALVLNGQGHQAVQEFIVATELGRERSPLAAALALAQLALLALEKGDRSADAYAAASLELVRNAGLKHNVETILTYVVCAWTAARRGEHAAAQLHAGAAQRLGADPSLAAFPWYGAQVAVALGRLSLELGDSSAARSRIEAAKQYLTHVLTEGVLRAHVQALSEEVAREHAPSRRPSPNSLTDAEVRVLQLLPTHLSLGEIAEELHVSRNTVKTQVAAMYRKLQAGTRVEAVQRGRDLGLFES
jgi:LuxR family maltose regulon positive regulatory protein